MREISSLVLRAPSAPPPPVRSKGSNSKGVATTTAPALKASKINSHARYYAIVTFNQIVLSSKTQADKVLATRLVEVYFELFRGILGEGNRPDLDDKGDDALKTGVDREGKGREEKRKMREREKLRMVGKEHPTDGRRGKKGRGNGLQEDTANGDAESKVISAILTGVNRALPFAGMDNDVLDKHMDTLFRITHEATFNVTIQALVLIEKVAESRPVSHPFYFLCPLIATSSLGSASAISAHVVCLSSGPAVGSFIEAGNVSEPTIQILKAGQEYNESQNLRETLLTSLDDWPGFRTQLHLRGAVLTRRGVAASK